MGLADTDLIGSQGRTVLAVWPGGAYAVRCIALERCLGELLLVADGRVLDRFPAKDMATALDTFRDLNPTPLFSTADLEA